MAPQDLPDHHDLNNLARALKYVPRFRVAFDVGAHRGIWTRELRRHFDRVIAFEPVPELYRQIPGKAYNVAIGADFGLADIEPGTENTGQGHIIEGTRVPVYPLDYFPVQGLDFLKIDVEGYELHVLKGAEKTLAHEKPVILLEKNGLSARYGVTDADIDHYLTDIGYTFVRKWNKDYLYTTSP